MEVRINGAVSEIPDNLSLLELLKIRNLADKNLIVELNGEIIQNTNWESIRLKADDNIELVQMVFGG